jgi:integrase/recombinase XerD
MKLQALVSQYVAFRKSLGELFRTNEEVLTSFCRALGRRPDVGEVRAAQVSAFLAGTGPVTSRWHVKYRALRGFYRYALTRGYVKHSPLPVVIPKRPQPLIPYIYSREELKRLFDGALRYQKHRGGQLEPFVIRTLLLFLYATGLRVGEALNLTQGDVDLRAGLVSVRESKFFKSRLVPLGPQLVKALANYVARCEGAGFPQGSDSPFFAARRRGRISTVTLQANFRRIRKRADIRRVDGARYQPRIHDLRHTFAVHRLVAWYREGAEVQRWLPHLSVYMGHVSLASTSVYLSMTPELLEQAGMRFEKHALKGGPHD